MQTLLSLALAVEVRARVSMLLAPVAKGGLPTGASR